MFWKKKKVQHEVAHTAFHGHEVEVNPSTESTLNRARGRLTRLRQALESETHKKTPDEYRINNLTKSIKKYQGLVDYHEISKEV